MKQTLLLLLLMVSLASAQDDAAITAVRAAEGTYQVVISGKEMSVPLDPANAQYALVRKWIAAGGVVEQPPDPKVEQRSAARAAIIAAYVQLSGLNALQADPTRPFDVTEEIEAATAELSKLRKTYQELSK